MWRNPPMDWQSHSPIQGRVDAAMIRG